MANNKRKREELEKNNDLLNKALEAKELKSDLQDEAKKVKENIEESASYKKEAKENKTSERHGVEVAAHAAKALGTNTGHSAQKVEEKLTRGVMSASAEFGSAQVFAQTAKNHGLGMHPEKEEALHKEALHQRASGVNFAQKMHEDVSPVSLSKDPQHPQATEEKAANTTPKPNESPDESHSHHH